MKIQNSLIIDNCNGMHVNCPEWLLRIHSSEGDKGHLKSYIFGQNWTLVVAICFTPHNILSTQMVGCTVEELLNVKLLVATRCFGELESCGMHQQSNEGF